MSDDLLQSGLSFLADVRTESAARPVTYHRHTGAALTVRASRGRSEFSSFDESGRTVLYRTVDWLFRAVDLAQDDTLFAPAVGDVIEEDGGARYVVFAPSGRQAGALSGSTWRVHSLRECIA